MCQGSVRCYDQKLIYARRKYQITVKTEELPSDINVGDKVRFIYDMKKFHIEECSNYMRKLIEEMIGITS